MSKCPDAADWVNNFYSTVYQQPGLPQIINVTFDFIADVCPDQPTGFCSKHGQTEAQGDLYEACVQKYFPSALLKFVYCNDQDYDSIPDNVQSCGQQAGFPWTPIGRCYSGNPTTESTGLMTDSIDRTKGLGIHVGMSPTVFISGGCVTGGYDTPPPFTCNELDPSTNDVLHFICQKYTGTPPPGCSSVLNM